MAVLPAIILLLQMAGLCMIAVECSKLTVKPDNMSTERFQQINLINLKDQLDRVSGRQVTTDGIKGKRMKRSTNPVKDHLLERGDGFLATVPIGFYKQDSLQILKIETLGSPETLDLGDKTNVDLIKFVNYVHGDTITKLKFIVQEISETDTVITVEKKTESGYIPLQPGDGELDFSDFIDFAAAPGATISDIAMGKNQQSVFNFLCITIDWPAPYPRPSSDSVDEIDINKPVPIPEAAKSKLFMFELRDSGFYLTQKMNSDGFSLTQTIGAKDCEFWVSDNMLMLGIAQTDNTQTHYLLQKSKIYYQPNVDTSEFVEMISEADELVTYEPKRIVPFEMRGTSCIMLVNSLVNKKESPVYCYSFQNKKFQLHQNLKTFGAQDAAYLHIHDTYPIHSESFMIVCNTQDVYNNQSSSVPPTVFKRINGRFMPVQTLQDNSETCQSVQAFSIQEDPVVVDPAHARFKVSNFKHFVSVHTTAGNLLIYQYNGNQFVKVLDPIQLNTPFDIEIIDLSTTSTPDIRLLYKIDSQFKLFTPTFHEMAYDMSIASTNTLKYCLKKSETRDTSQSTNVLYHQFQYAPKLANLTDGIKIHDIVFAEESSLLVTAATIESRNGSEATNHADVSLNITVENLEVITDAYPALVSDLNDQTVAAKVTLDQLVTVVNHSDIPKLDQANNFAGPLNLVNVNGFELTGEKFQLDENSNIMKNLPASGGETFNTSNFFENFVLISGSSIPDAGYSITDTLQFENIKINDEYNINKLHGVFVTDYVDSSEDDVTITGNVTLLSDSTFKDTVTAANINDNYVDNTVLILTSGTQTMEELTLSGTVKFDNLNINKFNDANLDILDTALTVNDDNCLIITEDLTVDQLTITGDTATNLKVSTDTSEIGIDFNDLCNNHMKNFGENSVALKHHYKSATTANIAVNTVEKYSFPQDFIDITTGSITQSGKVNLPNAELVNGITVSSNLVDSDNSYEVEIESGNVLPFVPTADATNVYTINATKTFNSGITLNADAIVNYQLQGLNPDYISGAVTSSQIFFSNSIEVSDVSIAGDIEIANAKIIDGQIKTECGNAQCTTNDLNILNNGILRNATQIETATLLFERIKFVKNVDVTEIDEIDPQNHFVLLDGTEERALNNIQIKSQITFDENLIQNQDSTFSACEDNTARRIYCKPEFCTNTPDAKCEIINKECLIKTTIANEEALCNKILTNNIQYVMEHSLKHDEEVSISRNVIFHGGFKTDTLEVRSSEFLINGVNCLSIASTTHSETFTGTNTYNGDIYITSEAITSTLNVDGKLDNVNINAIYEDSLFIDSAKQTINHLDFSENFEALSFQSNGISIGTVDPNNLVNRVNNIDRMGSDAVVLSKLVFDSDVKVNKMDTVTFDGVNLEDFYNKKITSSDNQEITGTLTVANNVEFLSSVSKGSESALVNKIDIVNLNSVAVRSGGDPITLNNVAFDTVVVLEPGAFIVQNNFVGVNTSDIVTKDSASTHFTADKTFTDAFTYVNGDVTFNNVQWKKTEFGSSLPTDKLFEFMDVSTLVNVKFANTLTLTNEPTIVNLNGKAVQTRISEVWMKSTDSTINFKIEFNDLFVTGKVDIDQDVINGIDTTDFNNYFSKSKEQSLPGISLTFSHCLVAEGTLNATTISFLSADGVLEHGIIVGENAAIKMKELSTKAIYLNGSTSIIPVALTIDSIEVDELNLAEDLTTNSVDLSDYAVTYSDTSVFNGPVAITSGVNIEELVAASTLGFPTTRNDAQSHTGLILAGGNIVIYYPDLKSNALYNDSNPSNIEDIKTFSGSVSVPSISASGTVNEVDIGTCESTNVLLKAPCSGDAPQVLTGRINFGGNVHAADVLVTNLNGENFDDLKDKFIYKTSEDAIILTGSNSFSGGLEVSNSSVFQGPVLGANLDTLKSKALPSVDMTYTSGIIPPNVTGLLEQVKKDSTDIPDKLLYTTKFEWLSGSNKKGLIKSLHNQFDQFPFHLVGVEFPEAAIDGKLKLFTIPQDYKTRTINQINSVSAVNVTMTGESIQILCIYANDTTRLLLVKGFYKNQAVDYTIEKLPLIEQPGATTGYMALLEVDDQPEGTRVLQEIFSGTETSHMEPIYIDNKSCVVVCRENIGVSIMCINEETLNLENIQNLDDLFDGDSDVKSCYSVSASPADASQATGSSFISINTIQEGITGIKIYKLINGKFEVETTTGMPSNIETRMFSFSDSETNPRTLLALLPNYDKHLEIIQYNQDSLKFEFFDSISEVQDIKDVQFTKRGSKVEMHVLSRMETYSVLKTYSYSGFSKFSTNEAKESLKLPLSVNKIDVALTYGAKDKFVITFDESGLNGESVPRGYITTMTDVDNIRSEFRESGQVLPQFISRDCSSMVAANLKALYSDQSYDLKTVGHLFLRIMPNRHIPYRPEDFPNSVANVLHNSTFQDLLKPVSPTSVANIYKYVDGVRTPADETYLGSISIYKENSRAEGETAMAYIYGRLMSTEEPTYQAISFWSSCYDNATQVSVKMFEAEDTLPKFVNDPDGVSRHQCSLVHDLDDTFTNKLDNLDNKDDAGVVVIHETSNPSSPRYGCGYLKKPVTAKIQFLKDHNEHNINPFVSYTVGGC